MDSYPLVKNRRIEVFIRNNLVFSELVFFLLFLPIIILYVKFSVCGSSQSCCQVKAVLKKLVCGLLLVVLLLVCQSAAERSNGMLYKELKRNKVLRTKKRVPTQTIVCTFMVYSTQYLFEVQVTHRPATYTWDFRKMYTNT